MSNRFATLLCLLLATPLNANEPKPGEPIPLTLSPAAAPTPSLKYRLLPPDSELSPGNAATLYYRSLALFVENQALLKEMHSEDWQNWAKTDLRKLPKGEIHAKLQMARHVLHEVRLAARLKTCDWQIDRRPEGIGLLLPDLQAYRPVAQVLAVKARFEIAECRFGTALETLQTGFAMSRHIAEGPTLIHVLVGAAMANHLLAQVEAFVQQPAAPNLYWGLTVLPRPFLDPQAAMREEVTMMDRGFPGLKLLEKGPATPDQVAEVLKQINKLADDFQIRKPPFGIVGQTATMLIEYPAAKRYLLDLGFTAAQVKAMPIPQPVILFAFGQYRESWEEIAKWSYIPDGLKHPGAQKAVIGHRQAVDRLDRLFFWGLLKALSDGDSPLLGVFNSLGRLDRRIAALRNIEAIRIYMAGHKGKMPASLADLTDVPPPVNPMNGQPFVYALENGKASLSATLMPGERPDFAIAYKLSPRRPE